MDEKQIKNKIGAAYGQQRLKQDNMLEYHELLDTGNRTEFRRKLGFSSYLIFYYLRRILLVLTLIYFRVLGLQILSMGIQSTIMIYFLVSRPLESRNLDETCNEMVIMLVVYHFVCLSSGDTKGFLQIVLGISCIIVVASHMAISLGMICRHTFVLLKEKFKRYLSNRKRRAYEIAQNKKMLQN